VRQLLKNKQRLVVTSLLFFTIWLLFTQFDFASMLVGCFYITAAVLVSVWLFDIRTENNAKNISIKPLKVPQFIVFFIIQSVIGGTDTARRAFSPSLNIAPGFLNYRMRYLIDGVNTDFFLAMVGLLPGSVYVTKHSIESQSIVVHFLALNNNSLCEIEKCERAVAKLYGIKTINRLSKENS
jgi:multicomponent Na+:H+ antiporter subunit E